MNARIGVRCFLWAIVFGAGAGCGKVLTADSDASVADAPAVEATLTVSVEGDGTVTSSPAGIDCGTACSLTVPEGTRVTLNATPDSGAAFVEWTGGCTGAGACEIDVTADTQVTARFVPTHQLTVTLAGDATGVVTSSPAGIDCGADCVETYVEGTEVTLTATASTGNFAGWTGACSGTAPCTLTMEQALDVTATFANAVLLMDTAPTPDPSSLTDQRCDGAISTAIAALEATTIHRLDADIDVVTNPTNVRFAIFDHATSSLVFYSDPVAVPVGRQIVQSPPFLFTMTVGTRYHFAAMVEGCANFPWDQVATTENGLQTFATNGNPTGYAAPVGPNECCSVDTRFQIYGTHP